MIFRIFSLEALTLFSDPGNNKVTEPRNSEQPILVADQAGDVDLDDGGQDEHIVLAGMLRGRAVNGMQYE